MDVFLPIWNAFLVHPMLTILVAAYDLARDFGLAIVLVTIAIRLALYPLFVAQIRSSRAMQELAPAMNELKQKYGKDRQRMAEEQMKLYKERGYNPAMGCLPMLIQMPILFAMYAAFIQAGGGPGFSEPLRGSDFATFLPPFVPNPVGPGETLDTAAHWLPWIRNGLAHPDPLFILPILAGVTQLVASVMAQPAKQQKSEDAQTRMMQQMVYTLPLVTVFFAASFPSGLAIYWVASTLFQIVQQYFVTGWGQLPHFAVLGVAPFRLVAAIPTPADRDMRRREQAAVAEARHDMEIAEKPGAQRAGRRERGRRKARRR